MAKLTAEQAVNLCRQALGETYWSLHTEVTSFRDNPKVELRGYVDGRGSKTGTTWEDVLIRMGVIEPDSTPEVGDLDNLAEAPTRK